MATSVFLGNSSSSDLDNTRSKEMEISLMSGSGDKPIRVNIGKPGDGGGGRTRKSKVNEPTQKKPRQRGMGVEQLEKLRFQERLEKMTEINPVHPLSFQNQQFTTLPITPAFGAYSIVNGGGGVVQMGLDVQQSALFSDHESKFLAPVDHPFAVGSGFRGSELSSIPNHLKWSSECGVCNKKFRGNGENLKCNGERKMCGEISGFGNFGNVGNKAAGGMFNGGRGNPYYASKPTGQEVEVMAVHRKGMNTGGGGGGSVLMEYEFFPGKFEGNYCNYKELINMASSSSSSDHNHDQDFIRAGVGEDTGGGSNDPIDLSLKLSY